MRFSYHRSVFVDLTRATAQNTNGAGIDTLTSIENLIGSSFNDALTGDSNDNLLNGGDGTDYLEGGAGNDTLIGGGGNDYLFYSAATSGVNVDLRIIGAQNTAGAGIDTLSGIEFLGGSNYFDSLIGTTGDNWLSGGIGNDILSGLAGDDVLDGGENEDSLNGDDGNDLLLGGGGYDFLSGGAGNDTLNGGSGHDYAVYATEASGVSIDLNITVAQNTLAAGFDTFISIESLSSTQFNDVLRGNADINFLQAWDGDDILDGRAGNDTLYGGDGNDTYVFGRGYDADTIIEAWNDTGTGLADTISINSGVARDQLWFTQSGNNLVMRIIGTSDQMTINNWYLGATNHVEKIQTSDGHLLIDAKVQNLVNAMAGMTVPSTTTLTPAQHAALDPIIAANWT